MQLVKSCVLAATSLALLAVGASAGTRIVSQTRILDREPARTERADIFIDGSRLRVDMGNQRNSVIFDGSVDTIWLLDHKKKTVFKVDRGTSQAVSQKVQEVNEALRSSLEGLPPEQRKAMEQMLGSALSPPQAPPTPKVEFRATGKNDEVNGFACEDVEVTKDAERVGVMCKASYAAAGVTPETFQVMQELASFMRESLGQMMGAGLKDVGDDAFAALDTLDGIDGVPVRILAFDEGKQVSETLITEIAAEGVPADRFKVPAGYQGGISLDGFDF